MKNRKQILIQRLNAVAGIIIILAAHASAQSTKPVESDAAAAQQSSIGMERPSIGPKAEPHSIAPWFSNTGLGLFVHYGIASVGGHQDLSWAMIKDAPWNRKNSGVMTPNSYYEMMKHFKAENYCPDKWLKAAKEAGFGYAVLTTRHHEGFSLWPSAYGDLNTMNHLDGRDLVKEFVTACRRNGLKVGFYYSSPDWYRERDYKSWGYGTKGTPESPHLGMDHQPLASLPARPADFEKKNAAYLNGQLTELLSNYGTIDYLWFDGSVKGVMSQEAIRKLQPDILINDRQHNGGDVITGSYEGKLPRERPTQIWEHCFSMVGAWGYTKPVHCLPAETIVEKLVRTRAWGGNVLANFGPQPDGEMPPEYYQCLTNLKGWMDWAAPAVIGARPGPFPEKCNAHVTVKDKTWFVFLLPKTEDGTALDNKILIKDMTTPRNAIFLKTGQILTITNISDGFSIQVPDSFRTNSVDILKISWDL